MKVAIAHHWLVGMRGGEKVLEAICELFPEADIYTLFYNPGMISRAIRRHRIFASWLNHIPASSKIYPNLLPLYPIGCRSLDLRAYDLVISNDSSVIKTVRMSPHAVHICYCLSPPRYLWDMSEVYLDQAGFARRTFAHLTFPWLRRYDFIGAQKVTSFVAISSHVQNRIKRHYQRHSTVIYPPVDASIGEGCPRVDHQGRGDYYLALGQLVHYKRTDLTVQAMSRLGRRLVVIGSGPEKTRLERMAGPTVEFLGWQPDTVVRQHLTSCRALIFPPEEDFGLTPVEAQMAGKPVIAYGRGGALETVVDEVTGLFFHHQDTDDLIEALNRFESIESTFSPEKIRQNAMRFARRVFLHSFGEFVSQTLELAQQEQNL